jgi:hypothetical protein
MSKTPAAPKVSTITESTKSLTEQQRLAKINSTYNDFLETSNNFIIELTALVDEMSKTIE